MIALKSSMSLFAQHLNKLFALFVLFLSVSCTWEYLDKRSDTRDSDRRRIVVTTGMIADMVRTIVQDEMEVLQLISHGVDPHMYRAGRDDIIKLISADLVFYNGLYLEGKMQEVLNSGKISPKAIAISSLLEENLFMHEENREFDPHIWMDVSLWLKAVPLVADSLVSLDPSKKEVFHGNARKLLEELHELHAYGKEQTGRLHPERRYLITSHDAFQYFGSAYGLQVYGIQGLSTDSEAGVRRIDEIITIIIEKQIPVVFLESGISAKLIESIIEGVQARGKTLHKGGILYTDSFGPPGSNKETYIDIMKHNFETIYSALKDE